MTREPYEKFLTSRIYELKIELAESYKNNDEKFRFTLKGVLEGFLQCYNSYLLAKEYGGVNVGD
jgi:hypothetical protein